MSFYRYNKKTPSGKYVSGNYSNKSYAGGGYSTTARSLPEGTFEFFTFLEAMAKSKKKGKGKYK